MGCPSDGDLGLGLSVFGSGLGFRSRFGKGFGHGLPGLARIVDRCFGNQSYRLPTNFQQPSYQAFQLGKIAFVLHRLARDPLVVYLC